MQYKLLDQSPCSAVSYVWPVLFLHFISPWFRIGLILQNNFGRPFSLVLSSVKENIHIWNTLNYLPSRLYICPAQHLSFFYIYTVFQSITIVCKSLALSHLKWHLLHILIWCLVFLWFNKNTSFLHFYSHASHYKYQL